MAERNVILTDSEIAVTLDALVDTRARLEARSIATPNVTGALGKLQGLVTPATFELHVQPGRFSAFTDDELETLTAALSDDQEHYQSPGQEAGLRLVHELLAEAQAEVTHRPVLMERYSH